ncbi:histone acetylation protein-domain-containing protein [Annulohypoxylon truncatum]|uniref:histone acetylation protein-domain-containing protein n=1 Tax=Annulohypoxylon truncatum TaxID=327061 RepID=UPI0020084990|nr:histone acetylation protein-domain-containing protein [Annulohypoxylon truncatum]KAI1206305.1 histone acetylation protein-domain-containing protein [Annulohypoxylon truncatum]
MPIEAFNPYSFPQFFYCTIGSIMSNPSQTRDGDCVVDPQPLVAELTKVLPKDRKFTAYHLSTPPVATEPLCHPPAHKPTSDSKTFVDTGIKSKNRRARNPLKTYCEKHFLAISIGAGKDDEPSDKQVLVLGLEIYIYSTSFSTTIFVAKADSTGYLNFLNLPKGTPSPIREITSCFLAFLVAKRRRPTKQLVVNLFARSQSQYLFPGSIKNDGKHVLDDRGLVKWWCRVFNSLLEGDEHSDARKLWDGIHGYLTIPGLDNYESRAFLPRTSTAATNWTLGHPLEKISPYTNNPNTFGRNIYPRSLIPTYPDDPKARFVQELEESTPDKAKLISGWRTPKTLDQFWEMMAFRQECSSGRMTGFMWIVFEPQSLKRPDSPKASSDTGIPITNTSFLASTDSAAPPTTPQHGQQDATGINSPVSPSEQPRRKRTKARWKRKAKKRLTGPIIPREPRVKTHAKDFPKLTETAHYFWPEDGRGQVVLSDNEYKRAIELLLHLEFGTLEQAIASTARWAKEVNMGKPWTLGIVGERVSATPATSSSTSEVNNLSGMIKRKRGSDGASVATSSVNTLGGGLVRKKAKLDENVAETPAADTDQNQPAVESQPQVNVLGAGLIRRKSRAA